MADFVAPAFEELCCTALWTLYDETPIVDVGQWRYQDHEIDVVGRRVLPASAEALTPGQSTLDGF